MCAADDEDPASVFARGRLSGVASVASRSRPWFLPCSEMCSVRRRGGGSATCRPSNVCELLPGTTPPPWTTGARTPGVCPYCYKFVFVCFVFSSCYRFVIFRSPSSILPANFWLSLCCDLALRRRPSLDPCINCYALARQASESARLLRCGTVCPVSAHMLYDRPLRVDMMRFSLLRVPPSMRRSDVGARCLS